MANGFGTLRVEPREAIRALAEVRPLRLRVHLFRQRALGLELASACRAPACLAKRAPEYMPLFEAAQGFRAPLGVADAGFAGQGVGAQEGLGSPLGIRRRCRLQFGLVGDVVAVVAPCEDAAAILGGQHEAQHEPGQVPDRRAHAGIIVIVRAEDDAIAEGALLGDEAEIGHVAVAHQRRRRRQLQQRARQRQRALGDVGVVELRRPAQKAKRILSHFAVFCAGWVERRVAMVDPAKLATDEPGAKIIFLCHSA
ncbi:MAG: hypothetical protein K9L70_10730 [Thiohalocapsa sp.]|nr:hypothetical protein [Thiohalocapsa sp.]MCF7989250.1 hypothetical protein [Thiohalocapsa sp.]